MSRYEPATAMGTLWRGLRGRCPHCGAGHIFKSFLRVAERCEVCDEDLSHHQADDFPAYLVIVLVGHIIVPLVLMTETHIAPPYWVHAAIWLPLTLGMSLALIQPIKGAVVAIQWFAGMHGFEQSKKLRDNAAAQCSA